ncbi:ATP-binding protein [Paracoccus sp. NFXS7]|uniref:ATP-binding protein n=1 Tax=Paracoccus sp. NFXS7 TaxID=2908653 RepID=UPI0032DEB4DF
MNEATTQSIGSQASASATSEMSPDRIPMVLTGQALLSLRDSGHSLPTALAEPIDNSLEARASKVAIHLEKGIVNGRGVVSQIAISDDGDGMDPETLHHYLQIGYSSRYMRTDTIGKYGVGAKLAALNFAKRIDVFSRQSAKDPWLHVSFDLDDALSKESEQGHSVGIDAPRADDVPVELQQYLPAEKGTLVVWGRIDKLEDGRVFGSFDELVVDVQKELSRIYREFISGGIKFEVNGTMLKAHDPLLLLEDTWADSVLSKEPKKAGGVKKSHFPATLIADEQVKVRDTYARVRITLYPEEVTRERGKGGDKLAQKLRVPENQGAISFMRKGREIAYTNVPRILPRGVQDPDRFIGIEVAFDPKLDDYFGVRNVKRGVEPHGELRDKIRELLKRFIDTARRMLDDRWGEVDKTTKRENGEFSPVMERVKDADSKMPKGPRHEVDPEKEREALEDLARDTGHDTADDKKAYLEKIRGLPFVLEPVDFPGKQFIDVLHLSDTVVIRLNTRHRFYRELWQPLDEIAKRSPGAISGEDAAKAARRAVEGLALMVVAFGKAESMDADPSKYQDLTMYWGQFVDTLMGKVKDV